MAWDKNEFCAHKVSGDTVYSASVGDLGGPLVSELNEKFYVTGIYTGAAGFGYKNRPGIYAKVADYTKWILESMNGTNKAKY